MKIHNRFDFILNGNLVAQAENVVCDAYYDIGRRRGFDNSTSYLVLGNGNGVPSPTDTRLFNAVTGFSTSRSLSVDYGKYIATLSLSETFTTAELNGSYTEIGLSSNSSISNYTLYTHAMITDASGAPITLVKTNRDTLTIEATIYYDYSALAIPNEGPVYQAGIPEWQWVIAKFFANHENYNGKNYYHSRPLFLKCMSNTYFKYREQCCNMLDRFTIISSVSGTGSYTANDAITKTSSVYINNTESAPYSELWSLINSAISNTSTIDTNSTNALPIQELFPNGIPFADIDIGNGDGITNVFKVPHRMHKNLEIKINGEVVNPILSSTSNIRTQYSLGGAGFEEMRSSSIGNYISYKTGSLYKGIQFKKDEYILCSYCGDSIDSLSFSGGIVNHHFRVSVLKYKMENGKLVFKSIPDAFYENRAFITGGSRTTGACTFTSDNKFVFLQNGGASISGAVFAPTKAYVFKLDFDNRKTVYCDLELAESLGFTFVYEIYPHESANEFLISGIKDGQKVFNQYSYDENEEGLEISLEKNLIVDDLINIMVSNSGYYNFDTVFKSRTKCYKLTREGLIEIADAVSMNYVDGEWVASWDSTGVTLSKGEESHKVNFTTRVVSSVSNNGAYILGHVQKLKEDVFAIVWPTNAFASGNNVISTLFVINSNDSSKDYILSNRITHSDEGYLRQHFYLKNIRAGVFDNDELVHNIYARLYKPNGDTFVQFDTPPVEGSKITASYVLPYFPKDDSFVFSASASLEY